MKKTIISFLVILNLILLGSQLWLSVARATDGSKLVNLREEINTLNSKNHALKVEIYTQSSLGQIEERSSQLQLLHAQAKYISPANSLAQAAGSQ